MKFEQSKYDNDKGVKEGSPADMKRDAKEKAAMKKDQAPIFPGAWSLGKIMANHGPSKPAKK